MQKNNSEEILAQSKTVAEHQPYEESANKDAEIAAWLVARCLQGDEQAFTRLVDHYGELLLRTAYLLVRDEDTAKDIVQETFIAAWKNLNKLREPQFLRAWLLKIVVNQAVSFKRQLARKTAFLREQFSQYAIEIAVQESAEQKGQLEGTWDMAEIIARLPVNQRVVLVFYYYHKMTVPEIAAVLDVSENTLRKRLVGALEKIRRVIDER